MEDKPNFNRPLFVDFELYTDGDLDFKVELIHLLINNIRDLRQSWSDATDTNNKLLFRTTSHKVKPSLTILNDVEFTMLVEDLQLMVFDTDKGLLFKKLCEEIIASLDKEKDNNI